MITSPEWVAEPPGWRLGLLQLKAMLWRQWLLKRRSLASTIVEVLSPIVLISMLVVAYLEVTPDVMPAKIYVNETAQALRDFMEPFLQIRPEPSSSNCTDLLNRVMIAGEGGDASWQGDSWQPSTVDMAAVDSCLGTLGGANAGNWTQGQAVLANAAVRLLQAFIDSNGPIPIPTLDEFVLLHKALQAAVQAQPEMLGLLQGARRSFGWNVLGNLIDMGKLAFAPATPEVLELAAHLDKAHEFFGQSFHGVFRTESEAEDFIGGSAERLWALVVFDSGPDQKGAEYTIRMNFTTVPRTWISVNKWRHSVPIHYKEYYTSGFLSVQGAIDSYVLGISPSLETSLLTGMKNISFVESGAIIQRPSFWTEWGTVFPTAAYIHNKFYDGVGPMLGLLMSLSLVYPLSMLVRGIVEEREKRLKETMCIMGLQGWVLHAAWLITYAIMLIIISLAVTVVCCASFLRASDPSLLLILLLFFAASELAFGLLVASVFSNAKIAGIVAPLAHFACLMPRYIFFRSEAPQAIAGKVAVSLLSPSAFTFAADLIGQYEGSGVGLHWSDMWSDPLPLGAILLLLALDAKLYAGLAWYLEKVVPSPYGPRLPWHFPLSRSFWLSGDVSERPSVMPVLKGFLSKLPWRRPSAQAYEQVETVDIEEGTADSGVRHDASSVLASSGVIHDEPVGLGPGSEALAQMQNLRKVYGRHVAVHNLTLPLRVDEMTALLGHNGAGKTTAVGMLTGLLRPTSGSCSVMGHDVHSAAAHARQHIGYCPQANVLFGSLTVWEHLLLFCAIKGLSSGAFSPAAAAASRDIMQAVGLQEQQHVRADALSGGMKRRLQVALALLGSSRVILLDEPTSGVDAASRRALWTVLARYKKGRAMLLTTHFMDEADLLSDTVAIMAEGRLRCWGTSLSLKQRYSHGYTLTLNMSLESGKPADRQGVTELVCSTVAGAMLLRMSGAETVYQLPMESSSSFADLLDALEESSSALGLTHYAVSMPTLEEVFLACTAESPQTEETASRTGPGADREGDVLSRASQGQLLSPDGSCVIQMSNLTGGATQSATAAQKQSASSESVSQDQPSLLQNSGSAAEASEHQSTAGAQRGDSAAGGDVTTGTAPKHDAEYPSDVGNTSGDLQHGSTQQTALSISRDDSAQMLWPASEEASHGHEHVKSHVESERPPGHDPPEAVSSSTSSSSHQEASSASHALQTGKPSAGPPEEEAVMVELDLDEHVHTKQACQVRWGIALREMLRKRALVAGRDKKGMLFQLLLPLAAICLVMAILKININPTSPSIVLNFTNLLQHDPVITAGPPQYMAPCFPDSEAARSSAACAGGLHFRSVNASSSYDLSEQLLADKASGAPPQYGALVFNDSIIADMAQPFTALNASLASVSPASWLGLVPLGLPLNPGAAAGSALAGLSRPETRVLSDAVRRFRQNPGVMIMHNASSYHALPALISGLHQTMGALSANGTGPTFATKSHPLPLTSEESVQLDSLLMVLAALFVLVPFCYLSGSFTINPVTEATSQARHLQLLSGCPPLIYWAGFYIWDVMTYLVVVVLSLCVFAAYNDRATTGSLEQLCGSFLLLLLYGVAVIPLGYAYSFGFASPSAAQVSVAALSFVLGFVAVTGSYVMKLIPKTQALQRVLVHFFRVQPPFLLGEGLIELTRFNFEKELALARGAPSSSTAATASDAAVGASSGGEVSLSYGSVFEWRTLGRSMTYLILEAAFFFVLTLYIDALTRQGRVPFLPASCHRLYARIHQVWTGAVRRLRGCEDHKGQYEAVEQQQATVQMSAIEGVSALHSPATDQQDHDHLQVDYLAKPPQLQGSAALATPGLEHLLPGNTDTCLFCASQEPGKALDKDVDVAAERQRVVGGDADSDSLCLKNLHKAYKSKVAVDNLCLGVHRGERFGLLGPNGAGKTTILGMLTRRAQPTSGDALVDGQSVLSSSGPAHAVLGFCPQQDPLMDLLTGREHLALYARLKGVPEERLRGEVAAVLQQTALPLEMAARPAGQYSGGSKRKLALGIALVGGSRTILLDEPSSGMDPGARRAMWNFIIDATQGEAGSESGVGAQRSVVLTTHSMEECEALCTRVGILDQGRLQCVGSTSHLKLRFGGGYLLEVHAPDDEALQARLAAFIARELGGQEDEERHLGCAKYRLPAERQSMARVFRLMEDARKALGLQAYGVSLPTLEQVFLRVVGHELQG